MEKTQLKTNESSEALIVATLKPSLSPIEEFAKAAMQGLLANDKFCIAPPEHVAERAYLFADALANEINKHIAFVEFEEAK